jgi:hypothetical protein
VNDPARPSGLSDPPPAAVIDFLARHGVWPADARGRSPRGLADRTLERLSGGANNAVFRAAGPAGTFLLKQYWAHPQDPRDRFGAEVAFCRFAWRHGIRTPPRFWAGCRRERLALFEFITGRPVSPAEVDAAVVAQAERFYRQLQEVREEPGAAALPAAADACFSIAQHLQCVNRRVGRLLRVEPNSTLDREFQRFVHGDLRRRWESTRDRVRTQCVARGIALEQELRTFDRVLSPSDFGFHNALRDSVGQVRFLDFEYAGWDDPAKLVCDFFWQVEVPVPRHFLRGFAERIAEPLPDPRRVGERIELLLPVYQIKWCCIVLNAFLPEAQARRQFSSADQHPEHQPGLQLSKARALLDEPDPVAVRSRTR